MVRRSAAVSLCFMLCTACTGNMDGNSISLDMSSEEGLDMLLDASIEEDMSGADVQRDASVPADLAPNMIDMSPKSDMDAGEQADMMALDEDMTVEPPEEPSFLGGREPLPGSLTVAPLRRAVVPEGMVGLAVGVSHGRIVTLCDQGRVLAADNVYASGATDHHPYSAKGLTFARGVFLHSTGHGTPGFLLRSTDGIEWEELSGDHFHYADGSTGDLPGGTATVYFADDRFVLSLGQRRMISQDGLDWYEEGTALERHYFHFRSDRYFRGLGTHFQAGENVSKDEIWMIRSDDQGSTYSDIVGNTCNAPSTFGHGALIASNRSGDPCLSWDGGENWTTFSPGLDEEPSTFMSVDDGFVAFRGWRRDFYHTTDLENWTTHSIQSLRYASAARSPEGYYLMSSLQNAEFYRSGNGVDWEVVETAPSTGPVVSRWTFGYAPPSEKCPAN